MISILKKLIREMPDDAISSFTIPGRNVTNIDTLQNLISDPDPETLYFGIYNDAFAASEPRNTNFLLYYDGSSGSPPQLPENCNTIIVFNMTAYEKMMSAAIKIENCNIQLSRINSHLLELVHDSNNMQKLLDYGSELLGNPMMMVDVSFGYIASSGMEDVQTGKYQNWFYTIENGIMPSDYIARIMASDVKYIDEDSESPKIMETYMDSMMSRAYSIKVMQGNDVFGYIKVLVHNHDLSTLDREIFLMLSKYAGILSSMLIQKSSYSSDPSETLLTSLLLQRVPVERAAPVLKSHFASKMYRNLYLINIQFNIDPGLGDYTSFAHKRLKGFFRNSIVSAIGGGFVILFDTEEDKSPFNTTETQFYKDFLKLLEETYCSANISFMFRDIKQILRYYEQTKFCIEFRYMSGIEDPVIRYSEIYEYQMITALRDTVNLRSLIHPAITKLAEVDSTYGSNLTETLFTYVNNLASITATAKEMYLHYNTVKHRLERIVELTSFDETNKDEIFRVMLSQKIMEITNKDIISSRTEALEE